jgi:hypothetical protein
MVDGIKTLSPWLRIHIPHAKRKYPHPIVYESRISLPDYQGPLRQVILRGNGREKPAFLISNDFDAPVEMLVGNYARRWRVENVIAEAVKFFNLNALSSPILVNMLYQVAISMRRPTDLRGPFYHGVSRLQRFSRPAPVFLPYWQRTYCRSKPWPGPESIGEG